MHSVRRFVCAAENRGKTRADIVWARLGAIIGHVGCIDQTVCETKDIGLRRENTLMTEYLGTTWGTYRFLPHTPEGSTCGASAEVMASEKVLHLPNRIKERVDDGGTGLGSGQIIRREN